MRVAVIFHILVRLMVTDCCGITTKLLGQRISELKMHGYASIEHPIMAGPLLMRNHDLGASFKRGTSFLIQEIFLFMNSLGTPVFLIRHKLW